MAGEATTLVTVTVIEAAVTIGITEIEIVIATGHRGQGIGRREVATETEIGTDETIARHIRLRRRHGEALSTTEATINC